MIIAAVGHAVAARERRGDGGALARFGEGGAEGGGDGDVETGVDGARGAEVASAAPPRSASDAATA